MDNEDLIIFVAVVWGCISRRLAVERRKAAERRKDQEPHSDPHPKDQPSNESEDSVWDAPSKGQGQSDGPSSAWINFQDPASTNMDIFNYHLLFYMIQIVIFVFWLLSLILSHYQEWVLSNSAHFYEHSELEIAWTVVPCLILLKILDPSLSLLHSCESNYYPEVALKAIGHQWYWGGMKLDQLEIGVIE